MINRVIHRYWLILVIALFVILRLPSLFEPSWYGDEGIYQTIGAAIGSGRMLYTGAWDNKPPLIYLSYALLRGNQLYLRLTNLLLGIISLGAFYKLTNSLFSRKKAVAWSMLSFAVLLGLPILEGNIANAENFMLFPTILGVFLVFKNSQTDRLRPFWASGILLAIAFLFKTVAVFDLAVLMLFLLLVKKWRQLVPLAFGFVIPILLAVLFFWINGAYTPFIEAILTGNVGIITYNNVFIVPHGLLILKLILLLGAIVVLTAKAKVITKFQLLIYLWLTLSLFSVFFSGRQYLHYLLLLLPAFCLLIGLVWEKKKINKVSAGLVLGLALLLRFTFPIYINVAGYYANYIGYNLGLITPAAYLAFFDPNTVINYKVVDYIKQNTTASEGIFVWGNSPQVYRLSNKLPPGRYTAAYHIVSSKENLKETADVLQKLSPKFIVILPDVADSYPYSLENYQEAKIISTAVIYRLKEN